MFISGYANAVMTSQATLDARICSWGVWEALIGLLMPEFVLGVNGKL